MRRSVTACVTLVAGVPSLLGMVRDVELPSHAEKGHIMAMPAVAPVTTIEELLALPGDGHRHELLDGEHVVTPAPALGHQRALRRLYDLLAAALRERPGLELFWSPADIRLGPRTLVQPDLFVLKIDSAAPPADWQDAGFRSSRSKWFHPAPPAATAAPSAGSTSVPGLPNTGSWTPTPS